MSLSSGSGRPKTVVALCYYILAGTYLTPVHSVLNEASFSVGISAKVDIYLLLTKLI